MRGAATLPSRSAAELRCREGEGFMRCITARTLRAGQVLGVCTRLSAPRCGTNSGARASTQTQTCQCALEPFALSANGKAPD
jgi:hypothetical protein